MSNKKMRKICILTTNSLYSPNESKVVGGEHLIPVKTANILRDSKYDPFYLTTASISNPLQKGYKVPGLDSQVDVDCLPSVSVDDIHASSRYRWWNIPRLILRINNIVQALSIDILHFFGSDKVLPLLSLLAPILDTKILLTVTNITLVDKTISCLIPHVGSPDALLGLSNYTTNKLRNNSDINTLYATTRPGVKQSWLRKKSSKNVPSEYSRRVLFWRDAEWENGADLCINAFSRLSQEFPSTEFAFAVRPDHEYENHIIDTSNAHKNITAHIYPYDDFCIEGLVMSSDLIVLPFRKLSIQPQISLLESLMTGIPVITSSVESNSELVPSQLSELLTDTTTDSLTDKIRTALEELHRLKRGSKGIRGVIRRNWNWSQYKRKLLSTYQNI